MQNPQDQIAQSISTANNVLVTVSNNPSVDQLSAAIGLTLLLNKLGKHATAVFSGQVPSTIEFLEPEKTLEKNTDSLRDFIISLDKAKADKLRYKVEDKLVKIFITPYKTSIGEEDLTFSQGDFNVDVVIALGVKQREQLDQAIMAHGRILHDATVISMNIDHGSDIGAMNWVNPAASSLCEMVVSIISLMKQGSELIDSQMATSFLTGIVAETQRFSNGKTSSTTMSMSAKLMASGANQQLIATKLEAKPIQEKSSEFDPAAIDALVKETQDSETSSDGAMKIIHHSNEMPELPPMISNTAANTPVATTHQEQRIEPISVSNKAQEPPHTMISGHSQAPVQPGTVHPVSSLEESPKPAINNESPNTLADLEKDIDSPHIKQYEAPLVEKQEDVNQLESARNAVDQAMVSPDAPLEPIAALNANPIDINLGHDTTKSDDVGTNLLPQVSVDSNTGIPQFNSVPAAPTPSEQNNVSPPPLVPPPMMPPSSMPLPQSQPNQNPMMPPVM